MSELKEKWKKRAESELKTDEIESLDWHTLEGIEAVSYTHLTLPTKA